MKPEPDPPPTMYIQDCFFSVLICLKLTIWALNWSMGMVDAGTNFFNCSLSVVLMLDKLNVFQILKFVGLYLVHSN